MHWRTIGHFLGNLALLQAACMLLPLALAFADGVEVKTFVVSPALAALVGVALGGGPAGARTVPPTSNDELRVRDAFFIVTFGWLLAGVLGAMPFVVSGALGPVDALFESVSGFTTTGATVFQRVEGLPRAVLLWRSMLQWLGGMGIIVLFVSVVPRLGAGGAHLFRAEFPGPVPEKLLPKIAATARLLWGLYAVVTAAATLAYWATGLSLFDALNHAFTTLSTGGFSTRTAGIWDNPWTEVAAILFMFLGGTSFVLQYRLYRLRDWGALRLAAEFWGYLAIATVSTVLVGAALLRSGVYGDVTTALRKAAFQVVSLLSTTGYTSADYGAWPPLAAAVLFTVMFVGGMTASTGGGPKVFRWLVMFKQVGAEMVRLLHPRSVQLLRLGGQAVPDRVVSDVAAFLVAYLATWFAGVVALAATGLDVVSAASATVASLGNIGPGFGSVGPTGNYAHLSPAAKLLLCVLMVTGRLELYSVLALLHPDFWRSR